MTHSYTTEMPRICDKYERLLISGPWFVHECSIPYYMGNGGSLSSDWSLCCTIILFTTQHNQTAKYWRTVESHEHLDFNIRLIIYQELDWIWNRTWQSGVNSHLKLNRDALNISCQVIVATFANCRTSLLWPRSRNTSLPTLCIPSRNTKTVYLPSLCSCIWTFWRMLL